MRVGVIGQTAGHDIWGRHMQSTHYSRRAQFQRAPSQGQIMGNVFDCYGLLSKDSKNEEDEKKSEKSSDSEKEKEKSEKSESEEEKEKSGSEEEKEKSSTSSSSPSNW